MQNTGGNCQFTRRRDARKSCFLFLLLLGISCPRILAASEEATPVREADAVCANCHREIFRTYLATPMAMASGLAAERLFPGTLLHARSDVEYQISIQEGVAWLSYRKASDPAIRGREQLDYFLGSGHLGLTYLYQKNNYLLESPIAYYPNLNTYAMKPGLEKIEHMPGALTVNATCLRCHMSAVQRPDPGTENRYQGLPFLHVGITCESCHGDTRAHVSTSGAAEVVNPVKLEPAKRDSICIVCHLEGATSVERYGRSVLDFKPGENIAAYISYFSYSSESNTKRGVSEIEQFNSSKCKRATGAEMSCMNCHDPHRFPLPVERVTFYRSKCLACHMQPKYANNHYASNLDCVSCHMPKIGAKNIPHVAWTDHRIRQHPDQAESNAGSIEDRTELVPILPDSSNPRDLALAYYNLTVNGNTEVRARTMALLSAEARLSSDDTAVLRAYGILTEWNGGRALSEKLYRAVLNQDATSLTATTNLGTLLAKSGDLQAAAALWRPVFTRNEDILGLGENLGTLECMLGEKDRALDVLKRVLIYSPDMPEIRNRLKTIESTSQCTKLDEPSAPR